MTPSAARLLAVAAAVAVAASGAPAVAAATSPHPIKDLLGKVAASSPVQISVAVKGRNPAELERFVAAVSDPASPKYRKFLTNAEYNRRFAPARSDVDAARTWLRRAGFVIDHTTAGIGLITAHATASTVGRVFDTSFGLFRVAGQLLRAPLSTPRMPSALRPLVAAVTGLVQTPARFAPAPAYLNATPCSRYFGQRIAKDLPKLNGRHAPYAVCGYTAGQLRSAYGVDKVKSAGRGATVAVVGAHASSTIEADVNQWSRRMGLPPLRPGQLRQVTIPGISDFPIEIEPVFSGQQWQGEESLDIEAVHGMAPKANLIYYSGLTGFGLNLPGAFVGLETLLVALAQAVGDGRADIVSNSWGGPNDNPTPGDTLILNAITNQAAAKGITIAFASGDSGDMVADSGRRQANFPATSPGVVAVGGTTLQIGRNGKRISESYWGNEGVPLGVGGWDFTKRSFSGGGGGGVSTSYPQPAWQRGVVPSGYATYGGIAPGRVEPDLSLVGDSTTGMLVGHTQYFPDGTTRYGEYRIGGTSLGCPLFAGMVALAVAKAKHRVGLVTPTLYAKSRTDAGRKRLFYDPVKVPRPGGVSKLVNVRSDYTRDGDVKSKVAFSARLMSVLGTLHARRGFDDSTGLGVPKARALVAALS
jgi:subtilase family serine protease